MPKLIFVTLVAAVASCSAPPKSQSPSGPGTTTPPPTEGSGSAANPECVCTMEYMPVCGADGKTYGNACAAGCAKVEVATQGECPKS